MSETRSLVDLFENPVPAADSLQPAMVDLEPVPAAAIPEFSELQEIQEAPGPVTLQEESAAAASDPGPQE